MGRLRRWAAACAALAAAASVAAPAAVAGAPGGSGGPQMTSKGLVSARYQAFGCDTAAAGTSASRSGGAEAFVPAVPSGNGATTHRFGRFAALESGVAQLQYQLHNLIPHNLHRVSNTISSHPLPSTPGSCRRIAASIAPTRFEASIPSDGRRLFQIAVAFALAYVVFLTVWFWGTRERRSRVGRAARS